MDETQQALIAELKRELDSHLALCGEILSTVEKEHQRLKSGGVDNLVEFFKGREGVLERLTQAQKRVFSYKADWLGLPATVRARHSAIGTLIRQSLTLITRIISLDRENEQLMLHRQLVPSRHLPAAQRQNPSLVSKIYRNNA